MRHRFFRGENPFVLPTNRSLFSVAPLKQNENFTGGQPPILHTLTHKRSTRCNNKDLRRCRVPVSMTTAEGLGAVMGLNGTGGGESGTGSFLCPPV